MNLFPTLDEKYAKEQHCALDAQRLAQLIAFGPVIFQVSRLMIKFGIFKLLTENRAGFTVDEIAERRSISVYAAEVLLESSLTIGSVIIDGDKYQLSKTGWFLLNDPMARVNMDFNHDVNYEGLFSLEESLLNGKPEGLNVFGKWDTIYEGLSQLPKQVQKSWFAFDHFYSDNSFSEALKIIFKTNPSTILDVGGNTGKWAMQCIAYNKNIEVTIADLPQQLEMMRKQVADKEGEDRIHSYPCNILDEQTSLPKGFDAIWMSQFLDCFSEEEIISILKKTVLAMTGNTTLYIMETFWDRQKFETAAFCLTQISLYFTAMANGNSKMYHSDRMIYCVKEAGLEITHIYDGLGLGHSIIECKRI